MLSLWDVVGSVLFYQTLCDRTSTSQLLETLRQQERSPFPTIR
ncbi:hypothetical protein [Nostoc sp. C117]